MTDNPMPSAHRKLLVSAMQRARSDLDSTLALPIELLASKREDRLEPPTSCLWSDNPILRPVEIAGVHNKTLGQETASDAGFEPAAYGFTGRHSTFELDNRRPSAR